MSNYPPSSDPWGSDGGAPRPAGPPLASWGHRLGALLVDVLIGIAIGVAVRIVLNVLGVTSFRAQSSITNLASISYWIWNHVRQGRTGQTIGKGVLGIRLARLDGITPPGVWLSIGRGILHFVVDFPPCLLGYLWPLWDEKRQTFADKIVNTVVVAD
jgi:uncharacterized RDD family membrane protein YckC